MLLANKHRVLMLLSSTKLCEVVLVSHLFLKWVEQYVAPSRMEECRHLCVAVNCSE